MIETDRLLLRPLLEEDKDFFVSMMKDPAVYRYILKEKPWSEREVACLLGRQKEFFADKGYCLYGVEIKATRTLTGYCGLQPLESFSGLLQSEVGASWAFHKDYWGAGLATEAAASVLDYTFTHTTLDRVKALIHPANRGSMHVAGKFGFEFEDIVFRNSRLRLMFSVPDSVYRRSVSFNPTQLTKVHPVDMLSSRLA